ncbi:MAG: hypothetical protein KJ822_13405 [Proteobacteria bacterium]|nr:hypothetical protein [Pseudomonadota bacterium]MBU4356323.1 hypothetical protein [Pseudomonadota bacterium]
MRKTNLFGTATMLLLLVLGSVPAFGAASDSICTTEGCAVPKSDQTDKRLPAYNDYALFIAGLSNPEGALAAYEGKPAWVRHAKFFDQNWERFTRGRLAPMREWAAKEVGSATTATVFYPFSGPDFVNVFTLFPHAKTYLLIALEPVGEMPDFAAGNEQNFFPSLQRSLYDLLHLDFFITNKMKSSIGKSELKGTLPVLMFFLAREQSRVLDVQYWVMKPDGTIAESPALGPGDRPTGIPGVRIVFASPGSAENQILYYFQFNLRNDSLERNQHFVSFLKSFGPMTSFTKAASYLMYKPYFSAVRQFILDQSLYVLQGDSGIPLRYFDPAGWDLRFYGTYAGPIPLFSNCYQADMANMYRSQDIQPLPFGIGYRHRARTSNLMFAAKKVKLLAGAPN